MEDLRIFFSEDSELIDYMFIDKCLISDVLVQINNEFFKPNFYQIVRLKQEYNHAVSSDEIYEINNNLILV